MYNIKGRDGKQGKVQNLSLSPLNPNFEAMLLYSVLNTSTKATLIVSRIVTKTKYSDQYHQSQRIAKPQQIGSCYTLSKTLYNHLE